MLDPIIVLVINLFNLVEETGRWPWENRRAMAAMLEASGNLYPGGKIPIVLLSAMYRRWVATGRNGFRGGSSSPAFYPVEKVSLPMTWP